MAQTNFEKLGIKPDMNVLVLGADVPADLAGLGLADERPAGATFVSAAEGQQPVVMLFAETVSDVVSKASMPSPPSPTAGVSGSPTVRARIAGPRQTTSPRCTATPCRPPLPSWASTG